MNKEDIRMDLDESCRTLGKDEMDFYWLHRDDPEKPAEEIVDILEELKKEGRIRYYGFSNYRTERLKEIAQCLRERNLSGITAVIQSVESCRNQSRRKYKSGSYTCGVFQRRISVAL